MSRAIRVGNLLLWWQRRWRLRFTI